MKLAGKLIVALVLAISVVMMLNVYLRLQTQRAFFEADTIRELRTVAKAVGAGVRVFSRDSANRALQFVDQANREREDVDVTWVWLDEASRATAVRLSAEQLERLRAGTDVTFVQRDPAGEERRYMYWPLRVRQSRPAVLQVSVSLAAEHAFIAESRRIAILTTITLLSVCAIIVAAAGFLLVGRPLGRLRDKARRVGRGDLSEPLVLRQRDEVGELAREINAMCDRLADAQRTAASETEARIAAIEQLRHADRLRTVGQLASGVAHELGTPLNVVLGNAKMIRDRELSEDESCSAGAVIVEQADRMTSIIRQLLDFSRRRGPSPSPTDLSMVARRTIDMLAPLAERQGVSLHLNAAVPLIADVDDAQIQQALANLIVNAIQASRNGGHVHVSVSRIREAGDRSAKEQTIERVAIVVTDDGAGITESDVAKVFEPFFTTKDVGEGTGLGLSVAYGIAREHGGSIDVESRPGGGSRFSILLPVHDSRIAPVPGVAAS